MPQANQQSNMVKPQKVGGVTKGSPSAGKKPKKKLRGKGGMGGKKYKMRANQGAQQGFLKSKPVMGRAVDKPSMPNHPNFPSKMSASNSPKKSRGKKGAANNPSYAKVAMSVRKTMGY